MFVVAQSKKSLDMCIHHARCNFGFENTCIRFYYTTSCWVDSASFLSSVIRLCPGGFCKFVTEYATFIHFYFQIIDRVVFGIGKVFRQ